jgi:hypothetical protein
VFARQSVKTKPGCVRLCDPETLAVHFLSGSDGKRHPISVEVIRQMGYSKIDLFWGKKIN